MVYADTGIVLRGNALLGIGTTIDHATSMTQGDDSMLGQAGLLGWEVETRPLVNVDGHTHTNKFEVTRLDPTTGERVVFDDVVVGSKYYPKQNEDCLQFADAILDFGATPEQAFAFNGGRRVGGVFGLSDLDLNIGGVDPMRAKLLAMTSHDGSLPITIMFIHDRLYCRNQISGLLRKAKNKFVIRHTRSAEFRIHEAKRTLGLAKTWVSEIEEIAEGLVQVPMTTGQFAEMATAIYPKPESDESSVRAISRWSNQINLLESIFDGNADQGDTTGQIGGTAWAGYNALIERLDWYRNSSNSVALGRTRVAQAMGIIGHLDKTKSGILTEVENYVDSMPVTA